MIATGSMGLTIERHHAQPPRGAMPVSRVDVDPSRPHRSDHRLRMIDPDVGAGEVMKGVRRWRRGPPAAIVTSPGYIAGATRSPGTPARSGADARRRHGKAAERGGHRPRPGAARRIAASAQSRSGRRKRRAVVAGGDAARRTAFGLRSSFHRVRYMVRRSLFRARRLQTAFVFTARRRLLQRMLNGYRTVYRLMRSWPRARSSGRISAYVAMRSGTIALTRSTTIRGPSPR